MPESLFLNIEINIFDITSTAVVESPIPIPLIADVCNRKSRTHTEHENERRIFFHKAIIKTFCIYSLIPPPQLRLIINQC